MKSLNPNAVVEAFGHIKANGIQKSQKENFEFDISGIDGSYEANDANQRFVLDVAQGSTSGLVRPYMGIRGAQNLDIINVDPTWKTDGQTAITNAGVGVFDSDKADGDVDLTDVTLSIEQEYFQIKINPYVLDKTVYGLEMQGNDEPSLAAAAQIMESATNAARNRVATRFFAGFGSSANNGLNDLTFVEQGTGAAIAANTILARMSELADAVAATDAANRTDNVILLKPQHYQWYINALVDGKFGDYLAQQHLAGRNETLSSVPFLYNPSIMVITDQTYTGEPKLFQLDRVVFGTTAITANEQPDLWYSKDNNAYFIRSVIYGGVQTYDNSAFFTPDVTA